MVDLNRITREFLLGESKKPSVYSYIQSISETLDSIVPKTQRDTRRVEMAKTNLREVRREFRRVNEQLQILEERVNLLEENREG